MNRTIIFIFISCISSFAFAADPIAHWSFDSANGSGPIDVTGKGNNGNWSSGYRASPYVNGPIGKGIYTGKNQYVRVTNTGQFNYLNSFSISAWVRPTAYSDHSNIFAKTTDGRDFVLQLQSTGRLNAHFTNSKNKYIQCTSAGSIPLSIWTHVTATWKKPYWRLYIGGTLARTCIDSTWSEPAWQGLDIAIGNIDGTTNEYFKGNLDEVKLFDHELSSTEVQQEAQP